MPFVAFAAGGVRQPARSSRAALPQTEPEQSRDVEDVDVRIGRLGRDVVAHGRGRDGAHEVPCEQDDVPDDAYQRIAERPAVKQPWLRAMLLPPAYWATTRGPLRVARLSAESSSSLTSALKQVRPWSDPGPHDARSSAPWSATATQM